MKMLSLAVMSLFYIVAGVAHFIRPEFYLKMMPPVLPFPLELVYLSGVAESALGIALWVPRFKVAAAWGIIALLVAVFPANLFMLKQGGSAFGIPDWALWSRLPIQGVFIYWAYTHTRA